MGFMEAIKTCFGKYVDFNGRARRSEYWWFTLFVILGVVVTSVIDGVLGTVLVFYGLFALGTLLPSLAVTVRRLHDAGKSGWFILLTLIPIVGLIILYFLVKDSEAGQNQYGPSPKGAGNVNEVFE